MFARLLLILFTLLVAALIYSGYYRPNLLDQLARHLVRGGTIV